MKSFKQYLDEYELYEALAKTFWHHAGKNKLIAVGSVHADAVRDNPTKFGLKRSDLSGITDSDDDDGKIIAVMKAKGWSRLIVAPREWNIETATTKIAWKTAVALDKKFPLPTDRIVVATDRKDEFLTGNQIRMFIKTGNIVKQTEIGRTMAQFR